MSTSYFYAYYNFPVSLLIRLCANVSEFAKYQAELKSLNIQEEIGNFYVVDGWDPRAEADSTS